MAGNDRAPIPNADEVVVTDDFDDVDLTLIRSNLRLTPPERAQRHYHARLFAERMRELGRKARGSPAPNPEAAA